MRPEPNASGEVATPAAPSRARILAAFAAIYLIWGSTYLGIAIAIQTTPPFVMAGVRFVIAGLVLYAWMRLRGAPRPTRANWIAATIVGGLLLLGGNGAVVWAEQRVPSGIAALLVATLPVWLVLLDWARPKGTRPSGLVLGGLALGLVGVGALVGPASLMGGNRIDVLGALVLMGGSISWAAGSLYSKQAALPASSALGMAMQMLAGGALLLLAGTVAGEWRAVDIGAISPASAGAILYLIVFGSLIGFTAYMWLLRVAPPARVATYAYVNPVVAVFLGWLVLAEPISARTVLAAAIIVGAVALIVSARSGGSPSSGGKRDVVAKTSDDAVARRGQERPAA
jgi:drug/metabolite transporter (DMT)-like permease